MLLGQKGKQYGLIKPPPKATGGPVLNKLSAFEDDSDEDNQVQAVEQQILRQGRQKVNDKKVTALQAAALSEDPSVFDYDGVYESMQSSKDQPRQREQCERKSKYIESLLEKAVERKREQDIRYERQLLKEREAEDHLFGDKERFVTAAYRRKLQEDKLWQQQQQLREHEEARNDVAKRGHMGDFYRNLMMKNIAFGGTARTDAKQAAPAAPAGVLSTATPDIDEPAELAALGRLAKAAAQNVIYADGSAVTIASEDRPEPQAVEKQFAGSAQGFAPEHVSSEPSRPVDSNSQKAAVQQQPMDAAKVPTREEKAQAARERYLARKRKAAAD